MEVGGGAEFIPAYANLHSDFPTQAGIEKKVTRIIPPLTAIESTGPIQFVVSSGSEEQIYPTGIRLLCEFQIRDGDDKPIDYTETPGGGGAARVRAAAQVFPVNGISSSMFSDIEVRLNDTKIESNDGMYAYKADIQKRLFTTIENKKHSMKMSGYGNELYPFDNYNESIDVLKAVLGIDKLDEHAARTEKRVEKTSSIWIDRWIKTRGSKTWRVMDRLYSEIFNQPKLLPPGSKLGITFGRSKPEFCLLTVHNTKKYSIHIVSCRLYVPVVACEQKLVHQIESKTLAGDLMKFPIRRVELHSYAKGRNITDLSIDNVLLGDVTPRRIFVMLVKSTAIHGEYKEDPFNYQHFNVQEIACKLGGQEGAVPVIKIDEAASHPDIHAVNLLLATLGSENSLEEIGIDIDNFAHRNNIYAFDINGCSGVEFENAYTREQKIPTGLRITLLRPYDEPITVLVYKEYDAEITCNFKNQVMFHPYA